MIATLRQTVHHWKRDREIKEQWGMPSVTIRFGGGIGDQLNCSTIAREVKKRDPGHLWMHTSYPDLFSGNPDINAVVPEETWLQEWATRKGADTHNVTYGTPVPDEDREIPPSRHILAEICYQAGICGNIDLRPYLYLSETEKEQGRIGPHQIVLQSSIASARHPLLTKEWFPERFTAVSKRLANEHTLIQLGSPADPAIPDTLDLRGKTSLRESAAILYQSDAAILLEGFLMHLSRAVDTRAVIIYGGRQHPEQSGYPCNENLFTSLPCSPCWRNRNCPENKACMSAIEAKDILNAFATLLAREPGLLETERHCLTSL